jgi:DNA-binding sugar fermentation-stimulating protein
LKIDSELVNGIFIEESKNRFLCKVLIDGQEVECYIPSSSKIENYIRLKNKPVLLLRNQVARRTRFSLFAVSYYNTFIIVNQNLVNGFLANEINNNQLLKDKEIITIEKEKKYGDYKADLIMTCKNNKTVLIEAKSIISANREAFFPTVYSERSIIQLKIIKQLLLEGIEIYYFIVSLSPIVRKITINEKHSEFYKLLNECIVNGLKLQAMSLRLEEHVNSVSLSLYKKIKVQL